MRLDPSIDPVELVHRLCSEAHAHPETKKSRWIKRMHPVTSIRKTLSVDLAAFAKEILKPHFHSGGPPKTVSFKPPFLALWASGQSAILLI
jgi:tRNA acetyltransferase TAN1